MRPILTLLVFASIANGQTVQVDFDPMPLTRQGPGLWLAHKVRATVTLDLPSGKVTGVAFIEPTLARGILFRNVDACDLVGADGFAFRLHLPREPVTPFGTALPITMTGNYTDAAGRTWDLVVPIGSCRTRNVLGSRLQRRTADAISAWGVAR